MQKYLCSRIVAIESETDKLRLTLATVQAGPDATLQAQRSKLVCDLDEAMQIVIYTNDIITSPQATVKIAEEERDRANFANWS